MKRIREEWVPLPGTIVFADIPSDIWFAIMKWLPPSYLFDMKRVCRQFIDIVDGRVRFLETDTVFASIVAMYNYTDESYWPFHDSKKPISQQWTGTSDVTFSSAVAMIITNFMRHNASINFSVWGDNYMIYGTDRYTSCVRFVMFSSGHDNKCYCNKMNKRITAYYIKNIIKHQFAKGIGCSKIY